MSYLVKLALVLAGLVFPIRAPGEPDLGASDAAVTVVEYGSLTCDYCIKFHREVLPQLERRHTDARRVRFIYRDFPTSAAATRGAIAARCAGSDRYYAMLNRLYWSVEKWSRAADLDSTFVQHASALGLDTAAYSACLKDPQHDQRIEDERRRATRELGVLGTPTFLINGHVVRGMQTLEQIEAHIARAKMRQRLNSKKILAKRMFASVLTLGRISASCRAPLCSGEISIWISGTKL